MAELSLDDLDIRLKVLERQRPVAGGQPEQCTAAMPHDTMMYNGEVYQCRCGMVYEKAGKGVLREVVHVSFDR